MRPYVIDYIIYILFIKPSCFGIYYDYSSVKMLIVAALSTEEIVHEKRKYDEIISRYSDYTYF